MNIAPDEWSGLRMHRIICVLDRYMYDFVLTSFLARSYMIPRDEEMDTYTSNILEWGF